MKKRKTFACPAATCALTFSILSGCGGTTSPGTSDSAAPSSSTAAEDEMFQIVLTAPFSGFDPLRTNDSTSGYVITQLYETLYRIDSDTGEAIPLLAADLPEYSDDGTTVTIKLREGVTFHDGTPFNSEAVKYTFELIKDPDFGSARASIANSIDTMECPTITPSSSTCSMTTASFWPSWPTPTPPSFPPLPSRTRT